MQTSALEKRSRQRFRIVLLLIPPSIAILVFGAHLLFRRPTTREYLEQSRRALHLGDLQSAEGYVQRALNQSPGSLDALFLAIRVSRKQQRVERALEYADRIPPDAPLLDATQAESLGKLYLDNHRLQETQIWFERLLKEDPDSTTGHWALSMLFSVQGRRWSATPHFFHLARQGAATSKELILLGDRTISFEDTELIARVRETEPDEPGALLGFALIAYKKEKYRRAEELLVRVLEQQPYDLEALVLRGYVFVELFRFGDLREWEQQLLPQANRHPDVWFLKGLRRETEGEFSDALKCYHRCLRIDPNHYQACYRLGQALSASGYPLAADAYRQRAAELQDARETLSVILFDGVTPERVTEIARLMEHLGRYWEAREWLRIGATHWKSVPDFSAGIRRLDRKITPDLPQTVVSWDFPEEIELSYSTAALVVSSDISASHDPSGELRFLDRHHSAGLRFRFTTGVTNADEGRMIYETLGGGIAVSDFDHNGWPDVYFTQSGAWGSDSGTDSNAENQLFLNSGSLFRNVSSLSGAGGASYSQGCYAGDVNCDGFDDIYVANIGQNRLLLNNGDGTFTDATQAAGMTGDQWTTSCVIADLNDDGYPEVFDVNYLAGSEPFRHICRSQAGIRRSCRPADFEPAQDRLWINRGDGTFQDITRQSGLSPHRGNGLGVVPMRWAQSDRWSLFVGNDSDENLLFVNTGNNEDGLPQFSEQALLRGLAYNARGYPQACMGIAAGDVDGDGRDDLFVTNYFRDHNTLYRQIAAGIFEDQSHGAALAKPSLSTLGFGCQMLDADLDSDLDLVVFNGHIDDFRAEGIPWKMKPQLFLNDGTGIFRDVSERVNGDVFGQKALGRSLALLDYNRDGLQDFIVSFLDRDAALVTNLSAAGNYLALRFSAANSERNGSGTRVEVAIQGKRRVFQVGYRNGYFATNERKLIVGLGPVQQVRMVRIQWPSGNVHVFEQIDANRTYLADERRACLLPLPE